MGYVARTALEIYMDFEDETENDAARATVAAFVTAQSGKYEWTAKQNLKGVVTSIARLHLPVADRVEANSRFTAVENNLDTLPRSGACVRSLKLWFMQEGLPDPDPE